MNKIASILAITLASISIQTQAAGMVPYGVEVRTDANPEAGRAKSIDCAACHGADGNSPTAMFPKLAGQEEDYLYHSLKAYKSGKRKNPIMGAQASNLSDLDMKDLAAYFAAQKGLVVKY
jgi:cytochrome c553